MSEMKIDVTGMDCAGCEESIRRAVGQVEGVTAVSADHASGEVRVEAAGDPDRERIRAAIEDAGYEVASI